MLTSSASTGNPRVGSRWALKLTLVLCGCGSTVTYQEIKLCPSGGKLFGLTMTGDVMMLDGRAPKPGRHCFLTIDGQEHEIACAPASE